MIRPPIASAKIFLSVNLFFYSELWSAPLMNANCCYRLTDRLGPDMVMGLMYLISNALESNPHTKQDARLHAICVVLLTLPNEVF